ncbi:MAG: SDR family oxidoreductase [Actinomycetota bacterium]|nr:SDR family oxidoreductase [Actinomycetota bacterium]
MTAQPSAAERTVPVVPVVPVVLVTGAAGGIGGAVTQRFRDGGWLVAGVDLQTLPAAPGDDLLAITADLRDVAQCRAAVAQAAEWGTRLDAVVNAAGVWTEGASALTTEAEFDHVLGVNLKGLYFVTAAAIPHLALTGGGVVNLSSDAGIQGNAGAAVYCASKGGVSLLTKALALELAPQGIRVNAVCPGDVDSPMLHGQARDFGDGDPQGYLARLLAGYPQGPSARFVRPAEVAELIWFLCQPAAAPITGANLSIDFGLSAGIA